MVDVDVKDQETLLGLIWGNPDQFRQGFDDYLLDNFHLWTEFQQLAYQMINRGRTHYSSKTIIQVMRFHSVLEELDSEYKISDQWSADYGRLFMLAHPEYSTFFKTKDSFLRSRLKDTA